MKNYLLAKVEKGELKHYDHKLVDIFYDDEKLVGTGFNKKASKHAIFNYQFKTKESMLSYFIKIVNNKIASEEAKQQRKVDKKIETEKFVNEVKVGDIFVNSWGYEQTNVDCYQIVEKKNRKVVLRAISSENENHQSHGMACDVKPLKDSFLDKESFSKILQDGRISMEHGSMSKWDGKRTYYCSWYY